MKKALTGSPLMTFGVAFALAFTMAFVMVLGLASPANAVAAQIRNLPVATAGAVQYMEADGDILYVFKGVTNVGLVRSVYVPPNRMYSIRRAGETVYRDYYGSGWVSAGGPSNGAGTVYVIDNGCCVA